MRLISHPKKILYYLFSRAQEEQVFIKFFTGYLDCDYSHVSQIISKLKNKKLLEKEKIGRSTRVWITEEGRVKVQKDAKRQIAKIQEYFSLFNEAFGKSIEDSEKRLNS